jgi:hypothetical protein
MCRRGDTGLTLRFRDRRRRLLQLPLFLFLYRTTSSSSLGGDAHFDMCHTVFPRFQRLVKLLKILLRMRSGLHYRSRLDFRGNFLPFFAKLLQGA